MNLLYAIVYHCIYCRQNYIASPAWEETKDASEFGAVCPQMLAWNILDSKDVIGEEDCLFLNVFTPKVS